LIPFDGFLPAKFAASEHKDDGNRGDNASNDNTESAPSIVFHDIHSTFSARARFRCRLIARENRQKSSRNFDHLEVLVCTDNNSALLKHAAGAL